MKLLVLLICTISYVLSNDFDYKLKPIKLAENSYYFYGKEEYFSKENGGDIANSSFIITEKSVILIDTGSSQQYGKQVKEEIRKIKSVGLKPSPRHPIPVVRETTQKRRPKKRL